MPPFGTRAYVDCKQLGHRTTRVQLRSGRHDNAKGPVTTPKRVQQQAEGSALQQATATRDASAANGSRLTVYKCNS